jgi:glutamate dehydrogenase/leucine dehydrogenase
MVKQRLQEKLSHVVEQVTDLSVNKDISLCEASYQMATSRLKEAIFSSGI